MLRHAPEHENRSLNEETAPETQAAQTERPEIASESRAMSEAEALATLEAHHRASRLENLRLGLMLLAFVSLFLLTVLLPRLGFDSIQAFKWVRALLLTGTVAFFFTSRRLKKSARILARLDDARAIGPLARMLDDEKEMRARLTSALARQLPLLQADNANLVDDYEWACLSGSLELAKADKEEAFQLAALEAIERLRIVSALPAVERLAESRAKSPAQERVRAAALERLPALRAEAERQQIAGSLLRAAEPPTAAPAELLRPAASAGETPAQHLLRAATERRQPDRTN